MAKMKAKLTALLMALCCITAGLGVVTTTVDFVENNSIVAKAEAITYEVTKLTSVASSSATVIEAYPNDGSGKPVGNWNDRYTLVESTGTGFCLNGEKLATYSIKQPNDFYIELGVEAKAGDIVTIDGTFSNANTGTSFVFKNCNLLYNGSTWGAVAATQSIGSLKLHVNSSVGGASGVNNQLYLWPTSGTPSVQTWDVKFAPQTADSFKINGEPATLAEMKSTGDGIFFNFSNNTINAGDYVTIGGTYYCASNGTAYFITESHFQWNGSRWSVYTPTIEVGKVVIGNGSGASAVYFDKESGSAFEKTDSTWTEKLTFESGSGVGITINGEQIPMNDIKIPNNIYVGFEGYSAKEGDILTIGGTFYSENLSVKYVIEKSVFTWNGSAWVGSDYSKYNLGVMTLNWPSTKAENAKNNQLYLNQESGAALPIQNWDIKFSHESGDGIKVNGEVKTLAEIKSTDLGLFLSFAGVNAGDVVTISGTFVLDSETTRYTVEESKFVWNGTTWEKYIEYTTYNVGNVFATKDSSAGAVYFAKYGENGNFDVPTGWDEKFTFEEGSGIGVTFNGEQIVMDDIKVPGTMYVNLKTTAKEGDVIAIGGTFYNEKFAVKYVIEESVLEWNGSAWVEYVAEKVYNVGTVAIANGSSETAVYFAKADGRNFDVPTGWTETFAFVAGSGVGIKINDTQISMNDIKVPGAMYVGLGTTAAKGDVLTIGGTFYNEANKITYIITESKFEWNGSAWVKYINYKKHNVGSVFATNDSSASAVYLAKYGENGNFDDATGWDARFTFEAGSGVGVTLNSTQINMNDIKAPGTFFVNLGTTAKVGDMLAIGGTFYNVEYTVKYVIDYTELVWNGAKWVVAYSDARLAEYDTISITDIGWGLEKTISGTQDNTGLSYIASSENTTGSVKFRFGYNSADTSVGEFNIRLRGSAWQGLQFRVQWGGIFVSNTGEVNIISLSGNTDYVIEIGAIDTADGNSIYTYIMVDGRLMQTEILSKNANSATQEGNPAFSTFNTNHVSIYAGDMATTTVIDPDHVEVAYVTYYGRFTEYVAKGSDYALTHGRTYNVFIGWVSDDELYVDGSVIEAIDRNYEFEELAIEFNMDEGAAIRLTSNVAESGIRFTTRVSREFAEREGRYDDYGIDSIYFGTLIMPLDYLAEGQEPNLDDFIPGQTIIQIETTPTKLELVDDYYVYRGAMTHLNEGNYDRLFAGRGYMILEFSNGDTKVVYTPFSYEDNVRSIRYIAQQFKADTSEAQNNELRYNNLSATRQGIVDIYAASNTIKLMNYGSYAANKFLNLIAWYYPELNSSNQYNNADNIAIAQKMKASGIKAVYLDGNYHLDLDRKENVEKTKQIIHFFWSQGLYTIAFGSNASTNCVIDYSLNSYPDFSDCDGFIGFLVWDEPSSSADIEKIGVFAQNFEILYAGTDTTFMTNLLPSYATPFNEGSSGWWDSSLETLKKDKYKAYLQEYCDTVLSQVQGEKWLSMDSYPINADKSLTPNFLFDLAMLKYYSLSADAHSHAVLQASGWTESGNSSKNRMPEESELRMQAYAAMAFGIDSISWWSYADMRGDNQQNPTDSDAYYERFYNVNNELANIGAVYSAFDWKGVILGAGKDNGTFINPDEDYEAFNVVSGEIGEYQLSVSDTKHLASVATNQKNLNYLMGVMEDMSGNEGYVVCNYNNQASSRAQTLTLTFSSNITEVVIYRGGVAKTVTVTGQELSLELATGEGVIVLPSKLG